MNIFIIFQNYLLSYNDINLKTLGKCLLFAKTVNSPPGLQLKNKNLRTLDAEVIALIRTYCKALFLPIARG